MEIELHPGGFAGGTSNTTLHTNFWSRNIFELCGTSQCYCMLSVTIRVGDGWIQNQKPRQGKHLGDFIVKTKQVVRAEAGVWLDCWLRWESMWWLSRGLWWWLRWACGEEGDPWGGFAGYWCAGARGDRLLERRGTVQFSLRKNKINLKKAAGGYWKSEAINTTT